MYEQNVLHSLMYERNVSTNKLCAEGNISDVVKKAKLEGMVIHMMFSSNVENLFFPLILKFLIVPDFYHKKVVYFLLKNLYENKCNFLKLKTFRNQRKFTGNY